MECFGDIVSNGSNYNSSAYDVSDDGHVIVGVTGTGWAFRWTPQSGMNVIAQTPGSSGAYGVSGDGSVVIGYYNPDQFQGSNNAFRWTQETGVVLLGDLPTGSNTSVAYDVSNDGNVIVGYGSIQVSSGTTQRAFYWDSTHGMRYLKDVLANEFEIDLTGWDNLFEATAISNDGTKIVGMGSYNGFSRTFLVDLATVPEVPSFPYRWRCMPRSIWHFTIVRVTKDFESFVKRFFHFDFQSHDHASVGHRKQV